MVSSGHFGYQSKFARLKCIVVMLWNSKFCEKLNVVATLRILICVNPEKSGKNGVISISCVWKMTFQSDKFALPVAMGNPKKKPQILI